MARSCSRGSSPLLLRLVADAEDDGCSVVLRLHELGLSDLNEGTVHPALSRLESRGLLGSRMVPSPTGPARKYYEIDPAGVGELAGGLSAGEFLVGTVHSLLAAWARSRR